MAGSALVISPDNRRMGLLKPNSPIYSITNIFLGKLQMLNPFIELISMAIGLIETALFIWIIISLLIQFDVVNAHQPLVARVNDFLGRVLNPLLTPIRRYVPTIGGFDLSPIVLIFALRFVDSALFHWFYTM